MYIMLIIKIIPTIKRYYYDDVITITLLNFTQHSTFYFISKVKTEFSYLCIWGYLILKYHTPEIVLLIIVHAMQI